VVGVREARFLRDTFAVGTPFRVEVRAEGAAGSLAIYAVRMDGMEAVISVYVP